MQFDENLKIHYKLIKDYYWQDCRRIKYRVCPNQLPWWKRNFIFNPWRDVFYADVSGNVHQYFSQDEYQRSLKPLKTLKEIHEYLNKQVQIREWNTDEDWK